MKIFSTGVALVFLVGLAASPALGQSLGVPSANATFPPVAAPLPTVPATAPTASRPNLVTRPASAQAGRQPNLYLAGAGAALFLATWVPALALSRSAGGCDDQSCRDALGALVLPVVGPFLSTQQGPEPPPAVLGALWSLTQGAGLSMLVAGIVGHHAVTEENTTKNTTSPWGIIFVASHEATSFTLRATF
jgi:hypothetical protein